MKNVLLEICEAKTDTHREVQTTKNRKSITERDSRTHQSKEVF